jgi:hypothetical protein
MNKEISIKNARLIKIPYSQTYQLRRYNFPLGSHFQFQVFVNGAMQIRLELNPPFDVPLAIMYLIPKGVNSQDSYHKYTI